MSSRLADILKPIDLGELKSAIKRYQERKASQLDASSVKQALRNIRESDPGRQTLTLHLQDGAITLPLGEIIRLESERNYTYVHLVGGSRKLCAKTLGDFEDLLSDKGFFRSHKSHLVNRNHIEEASGKFELTLSDATQIPISRRKLESFRQWLNE